MQALSQPDQKLYIMGPEQPQSFIFVSVPSVMWFIFGQSIR